MDDAQPKVSVVVPNWNGAAIIGACLAGVLAQQRPPDQVLVVDNGSADDSVALIRRRFPAVEVLELDRNHGFAGGANRGVRAARHPLVCVLNSDAVPRPDWLGALLAAPKPDGVWAWGSVLVSATTGLVESAGDAYSARGFAHKLLRERPEAELPSRSYPVFAPPGAAPMYRRDRFLELGGYDESFFLYYEDVDLAFRAQLRGWEALMVPGARVVHELGASSRRARPWFYIGRNSLRCAVRCLPEATPGLLLATTRTELREARRRGVALPYLAGRLAGMAELPRTLRQRAVLQRTRTARAVPYAEPGTAPVSPR